jgi:predicted nucleotidyltransferase
MNRTTNENRAVLEEVIQRIVEVAHPDKVILFGSGARGELGPHSDLDILVITQEPVHRGRLTEKIYLNLVGVGHAVDVIVVAPEDVVTYRDNPYLVIGPALREGIVIYDRETPIAR